MAEHRQISGEAARFRAESARLHSTGDHRILRIWTKLRPFQAPAGGRAVRRMALDLLLMGARWGISSRAGGSSCGRSRARKRSLPRTCAAGTWRSTCPGSRARSFTARETRRLPSLSFRATCSHASTSQPSSTSRPGPRASLASSVSASSTRPHSTTPSWTLCAHAPAAAISCDHVPSCAVAIQSRSARDRSRGSWPSSTGRAPRVRGESRSFSISFGGKRGSSYPRRRSHPSRGGQDRANARSKIRGTAAPERRHPFERWAEL